MLPIDTDNFVTVLVVITKKEQPITPITGHSIMLLDFCYNGLTWHELRRVLEIPFFRNFLLSTLTTEH